MRKAFFVTIIVSLISFVGMAYIVSTTKNECTEYQNIKIFISPEQATRTENPIYPMLPTSVYSFYTDNPLMMITDIYWLRYPEIVLGPRVIRNDSVLFHPQFFIRPYYDFGTTDEGETRYVIKEAGLDKKYSTIMFLEYDAVFQYCEDSIKDINVAERRCRFYLDDNNLSPCMREYVINSETRAAEANPIFIHRYRGPLPGGEYGWIQKREGEPRDAGRGEVKQDFLFQKCSGVKTFISNSPFMNRQGRSIYSVYPDVPFMTITRMPDSGETYVLMGSYKLQGDTLDFTPELYVDQSGTTPDSLPQYRVTRVQDMSISENPEMQRHVFIFNEDYLMDINRYGRYIYRLRGPLSGSVNDWTIKEIWRTPKRRQ